MPDACVGQGTGDVWEDWNGDVQCFIFFFLYVPSNGGYMLVERVRGI